MDKKRIRESLRNSESCENCVFCRGLHCMRYPTPHDIPHSRWCGEHEKDATLRANGEPIG